MAEAFSVIGVTRVPAIADDLRLLPRLAKGSRIL
jgi:hypothetical protein